MMNIILWIVFGAIAGFIADAIDKSVSLSWPERIGVGIVGAFVGGLLTTLITTGNLALTGSNDFSIVSMLVAIVGALAALFVYKRVRRA